MRIALSDFQTIQRLGQGAHGNVHEVVHVPTGRHFALKIFHPEAAEASLSDADHRLIPRHPAVLPLLASGLDELGRRWQAFPLLRPVNVRQIVDQGGASVALSLLTQAASGLSHLHEQGIIVADLKPDNLLIEPTGRPNSWQSSRLVISDLDLACPIGSDEPRLAGTRGYLAPELLDSVGGVTPASDVFALGAWLVWLISGREPFSAELNPIRLTHLIQVEIGNPTGRSDARFTGAMWGHIIGKMLDPNPASRLPDGRELLEFLAMMASNDDDWSRAMPALIRNPFVGSPANADLRAQIRNDRERLANCDVIVLQPEPTRQFDELLEGVLADLGLDATAPIVIGAGSHRTELLELVTGEPGRPIVLNGLEPPVGMEFGEIGEALELIHLARRSEVVKRHPVLCLVSLGNHVEGTRIFRQRGSVQVYRASPTDDVSFNRWLHSCFTSRPMEANVLERLRRQSALNPSGVTTLIGLAEAQEGLRMASGKVGLLESSADHLVGEAARTNSGADHLSDIAAGLYTVLTALPMGIDPLWLMDSRDDAYPSAAVQLETFGLARVTRMESGGRRLLTSKPLDGIPDAASLPHISGLLRILLRGATGASTDDRDESLILIRYLARADDPAGYQRGRALVRGFAARGDYPVLFRLLHLRRLLQPQDRTGVAGVLDLITEGKARVRFDTAESVRPLFDQAIETAHHLGLDWLVVRSILAWSTIQFEYGHRESAAVSLGECLETISSKAWMVPRQLRVAVSLHVVQMRISDPADSDIDTYFKFIDEDPLAPRSAKSIALAKWGRRQFALGAAKDARACFSRALRLSRQSRQVEVSGAVLAPLAIYHFRRGYLNRASRLFDLLERLPQDQLAPSDRIAGLSGAGALAYEQGQFRRAYDVNVHLYELAKRIGHRILHSSATQNLGNLLQLMNHPAESRHYLFESIRMGRGTASEFWKLAITHLAECELEIGRITEAEALLVEIGERGSAGSSELTWGFARRLLGRIRIQSGAVVDGRELLGEAIAIFEGLKAADEILITKLDCFPLDFGSAPEAESDAALDALEREAAGLRSWRIQAMVRLARLKKNVHAEDPEFEAELRAIIRDALDRGFVSLEVDALRLLIERLIGQGWINEAQDALKAALARIKAAADGFAEPELKRAYLASPGRQAFLEFSARIGKAQRV